MTTALDLPREGIRSYGFPRETHAHNGLDLRAPEGTMLYAARGGMVRHATREWRKGFTGYGRVVVIEDDNGDQQLYAHLLEPLVDEGQRVATGDPIGRAGRTGYSRDDHSSLITGAHLHFEAAPGSYPMRNDAPRHDPIAWLERGNVHPVARLEVRGPGPFPSGFEPAPAPAPELGSRLPSVFLQLPGSQWRRSLLEQWDEAGAELRSMIEQGNSAADISDAATDSAVELLRWLRCSSAIGDAPT